MNPFLNPIFISRALKSYLSDPDRLDRTTNEELRKYQDLSLKRIIKYAYNVPLYHDKYKKAGIYPDDIKGLDDIKKLPLVTKEDIRRYSPDNIIPKTFFKKDWIVSLTGGTTNRSLPVYFDMLTALKGMMGFLRVLNEHEIDWRKARISLLIDLSESSFENEYFINSLFTVIKPVFSLKNIQIFDLFDTSPEVIKKMERFQPEFIAGYPYAFNQLLLLRSKGLGENIRPKCILSSGACLDRYIREQVESMFNTKIIDFYAATESGPIAFECKNGVYHVHSDLVYPEFFMDGKSVSPGKPGEIIVTKLYGKGTPLIRYSGIGDIVTTMDGGCDCGLSGMLLKRIHGRKNESILLPGGKMMLPSFMEDILAETVYETKANTIRRMQIIQHRLDSLEIKILFDDELKNVSPPEEFISILKKKLAEKVGSDIEFNIHEVDKFGVKDPYYICKFDRSKFTEKEYLM